MIKVEDEGERISTEVSGTGEEILTQLAYLIRGLKTKMPKAFIMASVKAGLEFQPKEDEEEIIEEDEEHKKQIVKKMLNEMKKANKKKFEEDNKENK